MCHTVRDSSTSVRLANDRVDNVHRLQEQVHEIEPFEALRIGLRQLDLVLVAAHRDALACAPLGSKQAQLSNGQVCPIALLEDAQELTADLASRANDTN
jgi:hypothetical protein